MPRDFHVIVECPDGFQISFEAAAEALDRFDRLLLEPDGSFVWSGPTAAISPHSPSSSPWQIDGELYDRDGRLAYVVLKGNAESDVLSSLIAAINCPSAPLSIQLVREGQTLNETQFFDWLSRCE